jgi:hypothetical protein
VADALTSGDLDILRQTVHDTGLPLIPETADRLRAAGQRLLGEVERLRAWQGNAVATIAAQAQQLDTREREHNADRAEVERLRTVVGILGSQLQGGAQAFMDAAVEAEARLRIEDVERFLKRERDTYEPRGQHWTVVDDILDCFRLHMVTSTPLDQPRPQEGPEALGTSEPSDCSDPIECGHEAALGQARAEVERLTAITGRDFEKFRKYGETEAVLTKQRDELLNALIRLHAVVEDDMTDPIEAVMGDTLRLLQAYGVTPAGGVS